MIEGFWDNECSDFSNKLWKPPLWRNCSNKKWGNRNPYLTLKYFSDEKITNDLNFKPVTLDDKTTEKKKLFNKLFGREIGRLRKLIDDKGIKLPLLCNYITKLETGLEKVRKDNPRNKINTAFQFSNETFEDFKYKFHSRRNISVDNRNSINAHLKVFDSIQIKMEQLDGVMRCRQIKICPDEDQLETLERWFKANIDLYNELVDLFEISYEKCKEKCYELHKNDPIIGREFGKMIAENKSFPINGTKLRKIYGVSLTKKYKLPNCVVADTILGIASNITGNVTKLKKGQIKEFKMEHRTAKENYSISIQTQYTNNYGFYPSTFGPIEIDKREKKTKKNKKEFFEWSDIKHDYKLLYDKNRKSYCINVPIYKDAKVIKNRKPIAAMDPGMVIFQELYGVDHTVTIGKGLFKPIMKHYDKIEYMNKRLKDKNFDRQERLIYIEKQKRKHFLLNWCT